MTAQQAAANSPIDPRAIVSRYAGQPASLPEEVRRRIAQAWAQMPGGDEPPLLYAMSDLDDRLRLGRRWIVVGKTKAAVADGEGEAVAAFPRSAITAVRESAGLSCSRLAILGEAGQAPLADLAFTHRQKRAMEHIRFVLEQQLEGFEPEISDSPDHLYAEAVAAPVVEAQAAFSASKMAVTWRLLSYLGPYRKRVAWGMGAALLMTGMTLVPPFLSGRLIDGVIRPFEGGAIPMAAAAKAGWWLLAGIAATYILLEVFAWIRLRAMTVVGELVSRDLRDELYAHIQTLGMDFFTKKQTGGIISRVSSDTDRLWDFVAFGVVELSLAVFKLVGLGVVLVALDAQLGLAMMLPVPLVLWAIWRHGARMQEFFLRAWRKWSGLTAVLSDTIPGARVVKAFGQEDRETKRFMDRNHNVVDEFNLIHAYWTGFWPRLMLGVHCLAILAWGLALPRVLAVDPSLTVGTFVSFLLYMTMFFQPIEVIGQMARMLNRATSSAHRVFEVLDTEPKVTQAAEPVALEPIEGRVAFENVSFSYDGVRPVLRGVTFAVEPGEMIGLVGPSGAGKTTITNLIARFHDATGGRVMVDGVDVRDLEMASFHRQVGIVLQEPFLFHGTVLHNISYGRPDATLDEVIEAARAANAHEFVCKLPNGYDTIVGERGQTLSGGERQRVSIARAILADPRVLILDEATSSVDTETERKIQEALDRLIAGRTVFAIAHRLSTLSRATRLFVMEDGRLVETGTHAELLSKEEGVYRRLHTAQQELREMYAV